MEDIASELSGRLSAIVEKSAPSVVRVEGRRRRPASSGVVFSSDGVIVTAHHNVDSEDDIEVGLPGGGSASAVLVGRDPTTDLAALRVSSPGLTPAAWGEGSTLRAGHLVLGVSRPGRSVRASLGIASVVADAWRTPAGGRVDRYLQSDIPLQPGFSGSLLADVAGAVVGLNTAGLIRGLSTALPTTTIRRVVESLLAHGRVRRGFLGVGTSPVRLSPALAQKAGQSVALLILSVEPESPASRAGLFMGDAIVSVGGHPVKHAGDLLPVLEEERIGTEVELRIVRTDEFKDVKITVGTREGGGS
jgi:S1-C subfamily serine protease